MPKRIEALARAVSIVGHPFVTATLMVAANARVSTGIAFLVIAVVPVALLMIVQVRRGAWEHADASNVRERPLLYVVGIGAALAWLGWLLMTDPRSPLTRGLLITLGMLLVMALVMRWIKISLHLAFAALSATTLLLLRSPLGWVVAALVPLLIWSRLRLRRHTPAEVALGLAGGIAAGLLIRLA